VLCHVVALSVGTGGGPPPRLPEVGIDGDLREDGAEGVHGEPLAIRARLGRGRTLERLAHELHGLGEIVGSAACQRLLAYLEAGGLYGAPDAGHRHRTAMG